MNKSGDGSRIDLLSEDDRSAARHVARIAAALEIGASRLPEVFESPELTGRITAEAAARTGLP